MNIWDYAEGQDLYLNAMLIDFSLLPGEVKHLSVLNGKGGYTFIMKNEKKLKISILS